MTLRRPGRREMVLGLFLFLIAMNVVSLAAMLARRIVERHGGGVSFESEPGHTVFTVDLPGA